MARFSKLIRHEGQRRVYQVEINLENVAALYETPSIEIAARVHSQAEGTIGEIRARLAIDTETNEVVVSVEGEEVGRLSLDDMRIEQADSADTGERDAPDAFDAINEIAGGDLAGAIERAIDWVPVPDPVLGCILKGAIGATAGQIVRCCSETHRIETARERVKAVMRCVGQHAWGILDRAGRRAFSCFVRFGIG